jgi:hypothetical protein
MMSILPTYLLIHSEHSRHFSKMIKSSRVGCIFEMKFIEKDVYDEGCGDSVNWVTCVIRAS